MISLELELLLVDSYAFDAFHIPADIGICLFHRDLYRSLLHFLFLLNYVLNKHFLNSMPLADLFVDGHRALSQRLKHAFALSVKELVNL